MTSQAMAGALTITFSAAALQVAASVAIGLREILLSPDRPNYPDACRPLRVAMFALSAALLYHGVDQACQALAGVPRYSRPAGVLLSALWLACSGLELDRTVRQWLPASKQRRVQQLFRLATCRKGAALGCARRQEPARAVQSDVRRRGELRVKAP